MSIRARNIVTRFKVGSPVAKNVLLLLADSLGPKGCYPTVAFLAMATEYSQRSVISALNDLEQAGYIKRLPHKGRRSAYALRLEGEFHQISGTVDGEQGEGAAPSKVKELHHHGEGAAPYNCKEPQSNQLPLPPSSEEAEQKKITDPLTDELFRVLMPKLAKMAGCTQKVARGRMAGLLKLTPNRTVVRDALRETIEQGPSGDPFAYAQRIIKPPKPSIRDEETIRSEIDAQVMNITDGQERMAEKMRLLRAEGLLRPFI